MRLSFCNITYREFRPFDGQNQYIVWMQIDEWVFGLTKKEIFENAFVWAGPLSRMIRLIRFVTIRDDQT